MKTAKIGGALAALVMVISLAGPKAHADDYHLTTLLTFSHAVQLPGNRVLRPGNYRFRLFDPENNLNVIAIYDATRPHIEALLDTRPSFRYIPTDRTVLTLARQGRGRPDALLRVFFPGHEYGYDFIYSKQMEGRLDRDRKLTVLAPNEDIQ